MTPIGIALCITDLDVGGAERHLTELATRIDRRRFTPVVYCLGPNPVRDEASCVPALRAAGVEVHCLGARGVWQFLSVVRRLHRLLASQKPQIVQTFMFHANIVGRIAARCAEVKTVVAGIRVAERSARWHLWFDRLTQRWVDRYVCVSQSVADFSSHRAGLPAEKLVVIPNGIDADRYPAEDRPNFHPSENGSVPVPAILEGLGIPSGRRAVTFVGRLEPQKGVDWLIESAPQWMTQLPDCDLLLVGDGPLRTTLACAASTAGIADRVHFVGWRPDVPQILDASSLLVLPSAWEGMPNVVLEAMVSRLPVVATDVEGVVELLGPLAPPQTVRYRDTQSLVRQIVALMSSPGAATALGEENRRRVEQHFAISRTVAAYEDLWESLVRK